MDWVKGFLLITIGIAVVFIILREKILSLLDNDNTNTTKKSRNIKFKPKHFIIFTQLVILLTLFSNNPFVPLFLLQTWCLFSQFALVLFVVSFILLESKKFKEYSLIRALFSILAMIALTILVFLDIAGSAIWIAAGFIEVLDFFN